MWTVLLFLSCGDGAEPAPPKSATAPSKAKGKGPPDPKGPCGMPKGSGDAHVQQVDAVQDKDGTWTFSVTISHADQSPDDYADGWNVCTRDSQLINPDPQTPFTRPLLHPHNEQSFTRSQSGIVIAPGTTALRVRAHDSKDNWGGREVILDLNKPRGPGFTVQR